MTPEDTNKIVAAIDRNTEAINWSGASRAAMLCLLICAVVGCPPAKASPITHVPVAEPPLQYWHTQWVPMDGGVYPLEVYAPALPKVEPEPYVFVDIGDPPRLMETPEPGTWWLVGLVLLTAVCVIILKSIATESMREWELGAKRCARYRLALEEIAATDTDNGHIARKALEE